MKQNVCILLFLSLLTIGNIFVSKAQTTEKEYTGPLDILNDMAPKINENSDLYTGQFRIKIPLYTYQDKDFTIPLVLEYASTGFKINQPIGATGLGWNLKCGGSITRIINGVADELGMGTYGDRGYWQYHEKNMAEKDDNTLMNNGCLFPFKASPDPQRMYCWEDNIETTPDIFFFNFGDHKGNFCLGPNHSIHVFNTNHPHGEYKIEITRTSSSNSSYRYGKLAFKITTGDGYSYIFDVRNGEDGFLGNYANLDDRRRDQFPYFYSRAPYMEWYLVEIKASNGRKVTFEYGEQEEYESCRPSYGSEVTWNKDGIRSNKSSIPGISWGFENRRASVLPIKKITIDNTSIAFDYEERLEELLLAGNPISVSPSKYHLEKVSTISRLRSIQINDESTSSFLKTCSFVYGYSNINPIGLDTLTYGRPVLFLKTVGISGVGSYQMDYYNESNLYPLMGQGSDPWGYYCDGMTTSPPMEITNNNYQESYFNEYSFYKVVSGMLKKITYPSGGYAKYDYEEHIINDKVTKDLTHNNNPYLAPGGIAGGVRIKRITDFANPNDSTYRVFYYGYDGDPGAYSGILLHSPRYYRRVNAEERTSLHNVSCWSDVFLPSDQEFLSPYSNYTYTQDQTHVGYSEVAERFPDGSYILYSYSDYNLLPDLEYNSALIKKMFEIQSSTPAFVDNFYAQYDSRHTQRGKLISKKYFSNQEKLVYAEEYKYNYNKVLKYIPTAKLAYSYFYLSKLFVDDYPLDQVIKTTYAQNSYQNKIVETISFVYNDLGQIINKSVINSAGQTISVKTQFVNDISPALREPVHNSMIAKNMVGHPVRTQTSVLNSGVITGERFKFQVKNNGFIYLSEEQKTAISTPLSSNDFQFDSYLMLENSYIYNDAGNVIQKKGKDGIPITYLWSYNYKYPVAEIKNATYADVVATISGGETTINAIAASDLLSSASLSKLNALRTQLTNAEVTTYTYKPAIGMASMTDPYGFTTYYDYDPFGRLKESYYYENNATTDPSKKRTIETYQYHYQNP